MSVKHLENIVIPVPPLTIQKSIVSQLNLLRDKTQQLESIYQKKLTALTEIKQSILQKAFSGELTAESVKQQVAV